MVHFILIFYDGFVLNKALPYNNTVENLIVFI